MIITNLNEVEINNHRYPLISSYIDTDLITLQIATNFDTTSLKTDCIENNKILKIFYNDTLSNTYDAYDEFVEIRDVVNSVFVTFKKSFDDYVVLNSIFNRRISIGESKKIKKIINKAIKFLNPTDSVLIKFMYPEWMPEVQYSIKDKVVYGDDLYSCNKAHTSSQNKKPDTMHVEWVKMSLNVDDWNGMNVYKKGDLVVYEGLIYECVKDSTSSIPTIYNEDWSVYF